MHLAGTEAAKCDPIIFDQCQQSFAKSISGDQSLDWTKPLQLQQAIQVSLLIMNRSRTLLEFIHHWHE